MPRTWVITGTDRPAGAGFARHALARGENVVAAGPVRPGLPVNGAGALLRVETGGGDPARLAPAIAAAEDRFGRIDVLVHSAGAALVGAAEEIGADDLRALVEASFLTPVALTRAVLPGMRARRAGAVVVLSSAAGRMSAPGFGALSAAMAALEGWTEALAREIAPFGLRAMIAAQGGLARSAVRFRTRCPGWRPIGTPLAPRGIWLSRPARTPTGPRWPRRWTARWPPTVRPFVWCWMPRRPTRSATAPRPFWPNWP